MPLYSLLPSSTSSVHGPSVHAFPISRSGAESRLDLIFLRLKFFRYKLNGRNFVFLLKFCQLNCHITDFSCAISNFFAVASAWVVHSSFREGLELFLKKSLLMFFGSFGVCSKIVDLMGTSLIFFCVLSNFHQFSMVEFDRF